MQFDMQRKKIFTLVFLVVLIAAAFVRYQYIFAESIWVDESVYMWQGYKLLHSPSLIFDKDYYGNTPVPLVVIAFFNLFTLDRFIAGRLAAYFFTLLGILLAYLIGKQIKNEYVGILAALLLTFNPLHWFLGSRTLMDLPEATMVCLSAYLLLRFESNRTRANFLFLVISVIATALTKLPGLLIVPGIMLYYFLRASAAPSRAVSIIKNNLPAACVVGIILLVMMATKWGFIMGLLRAMEPRTIFFEHFPFMFSSIIIFFMAVGIIFSFYYKKWDVIAMICIFFSFIAAFSVFPAEPDPRHIIPIVPLGIIMASYALFELGAVAKLFFNLPLIEIGLLVIGSLLVIPLYQTGVALNVDKSYAFTGYNEAGQWFAENLPKGALAYVSSQGPIRLFSGLGYANEDGPIRQIQTFGNGEIPDFSNATFPIYMHIDMWEQGPQWSYPLNEKKLAYLQSLGFNIMKIVTRKYPTKNGIQDVPVHMILVKERKKLM